MLFRNLRAALQVSLLPYLASLGLTVLLGGTAFLTGDLDAVAAHAGEFIVVAVLSCALWASAAVNWHRHVLASEPVGWLPRVRAGRVVSYLLRCALIGIGLAMVLGVAALPLCVLPAVQGTLGTVMGGAFALLVGAIGLSSYWRISVALPGAALDGGASLAEVWGATEGSFWTMLALVLIVLGFSVALGALSGLLSLIPVLGLVADLVGQWVIAMLGLSLLTTVYGHFIEKRTLV